VNSDYWQRQDDTPLFPELEWSRPETKTLAGKLLIIGGTKHGFATPAEAYSAGLQAGIGSVRVMLPESLRRAVSKLFPGADFAPSTISGSFAASSLAELCGAASWADGVLFPGEISRNSETTVLLENFLEKHSGQVTITKDAADLLCQQPQSILHRPETLLVLAMGQLQKLGSEARFPRAFTSEMGLVQLVDNLHELTKRFACIIITKHQGQLVLAMNGQVSTTKAKTEQSVWRLKTATTASVWWLQNPSKSFEALTTALFTIS
jgi:NAD(P)H-hydrate repair Nnr-like enzyme with NAD(P)H-hydrate dehydratase domain